MVTMQAWVYWLLMATVCINSVWCMWNSYRNIRILQRADKRIEELEALCERLRNAL